MTEYDDVLLSVRDLARWYDLNQSPLQQIFRRGSNRLVKAVDGVSFDIRRGETFALIGESGCGKSTVARTLIGLNAPTRGQITFDGIDIGASSRDAVLRRRMQMIFQDPYASLNPRWLVKDIISEPILVNRFLPRSKISKRVDELLRSVNLSPADAEKYPHEFSGGQRQRISIARALASSPEFLICDEPTSALDVSVQAQILNLMKDLQDELGLTYLFISHNLAVIKQVSDRIGVMYLGKLVEISSSSNLFSNPRHPYTKALIGAIPDVGKIGVEGDPIAGEVPSPLSPPTGCAFHPRCPLVMDRCRSESPALESFSSGHAACHAVALSEVGGSPSAIREEAPTRPHECDAFDQSCRERVYGEVEHATFAAPQSQVADSCGDDSATGGLAADSTTWVITFGRKFASFVTFDFDDSVLPKLRRSPTAIAALAFLLVIAIGALGAPWLAPHNTMDLTKVDLVDASLPPFWSPDGDWRFLLGTDHQGRDLLSTILFGLRISITVSVLSVAFALALGVGVGLVSGFFGGTLDAFLMRIVDIQLSFPAVLVALLINGVARILMGGPMPEDIAIFVLVFAIGITGWMQFARTVRASTLVEKNKEYVQAATIVGRHPLMVMLRHILPNVLGPVLVLTTLFLGVAIITEATLSFLGVGLSPSRPSLGTLIRVGGNYLFSGEWWVTVFPGLTLAVLVLSVNLLGDWLRDVLNPKLR